MKQNCDRFTIILICIVLLIMFIIIAYNMGYYKGYNDAEKEYNIYCRERIDTQKENHDNMIEYIMRTNCMNYNYLERKCNITTTVNMCNIKME
jgi:hypothetical protein